MQNVNLFGLFLATLVFKDFHQVDESLRPILEEISPKITAAVMAFLGQGVSPQTTFELEKELQRLLREIGRRTLETVFNRLELCRSRKLTPVCSDKLIYLERRRGILLSSSDFRM